MVQVDVFWTYALGASFAVAASRQIKAEPAEEKKPWYISGYFTAALLYLAVLFAPSGVCLLWAFPSWETMHVGDRNLPAWLVTLFAATNITQGVLGYWVAYTFIKQGKRYAAFLQVVVGYFFLFFILIHGWDGTGYQRFFSATKADFLAWNWTNVFAWLISDVAITLYIFGVFLLPTIFYAMSSWIINGRANDKNDAVIETTKMQVTLPIVKVIFVACLGVAIAASLLIHLAGWIGGGLIFIAAAYILAFRKGGLVYNMARKMLLVDGEL